MQWRTAVGDERDPRNGLFGGRSGSGAEASSGSQGVGNIWMGYDHLSLLTLLLPAVVYRARTGGWTTQPSLRAAVVDVVRVVTAFTLAHSLTLVLASMGVVRFETRWVESAIALTVLLGAINILFPFVRERRWALALVFGLIHGLGFAAALGDLGLGGRNLVRNLLLQSRRRSGPLAIRGGVRGPPPGCCAVRRCIATLPCPAPQSWLPRSHCGGWWSA